MASCGNWNFGIEQKIFLTQKPIIVKSSLAKTVATVLISDQNFFC